MKQMRDNHIRHHNVDHRYWLAFSIPAVDDFFGTNPDVQEVRRQNKQQQNAIDRWALIETYHGSFRYEVTIGIALDSVLKALKKAWKKVTFQRGQARMARCTSCYQYVASCSYDASVREYRTRQSI